MWVIRKGFVEEGDLSWGKRPGAFAMPAKAHAKHWGKKTSVNTSVILALTWKVGAIISVWSN